MTKTEVDKPFLDAIDMALTSQIYVWYYLSDDDRLWYKSLLNTIDTHINDLKLDTSEEVLFMKYLVLAKLELSFFSELNLGSMSGFRPGDELGKNVEIEPFIRPSLDIYNKIISDNSISDEKSFVKMPDRLKSDLCKNAFAYEEPKLPILLLSAFRIHRLLHSNNFRRYQHNLSSLVEPELSPAVRVYNFTDCDIKLDRALGIKSELNRELRLGDLFTQMSWSSDDQKREASANIGLYRTFLILDLERIKSFLTKAYEDILKGEYDKDKPIDIMIGFGAFRGVWGVIASITASSFNKTDMLGRFFKFVSNKSKDKRVFDLSSTKALTVISGAMVLIGKQKSEKPIFNNDGKLSICDEVQEELKKFGHDRDTRNIEKAYKSINESILPQLSGIFGSR